MRAIFFTNRQTPSLAEAASNGQPPTEPARHNSTWRRVVLRGVLGCVGLMLLALPMCQPVLAGTIIQEEISAFVQIFGNASIGQTFTAESDHIARLALLFEDFNSGLLNGSTAVRLYEGDTIAGVPIFVDAQEITPGTENLVFFNFHEVPLTIGATYTLEVERFNARWGLGVYQHQFSNGDPIPGREDYAGGHAIFNGQPAPGYDLRFRLIPLTPGDANSDGLVDGRDYLAWASNFGDDPADDPPGWPANGDFNDNGRVDGFDYIIWAEAFFSPQSAAIPEPSSLALALMATALTASLQRRRRAARLG